MLNLTVFLAGTLYVLPLISPEVADSVLTFNVPKSVPNATSSPLNRVSVMISFNKSNALFASALDSNELHSAEPFD